MREIENNTKGNKRFEFVAKMISMDDPVLQNTNGKNYKLSTIEFLDVNNILQQAKSAIYEAVYKNGVEINSKFAAIATIADDKAYVNVTAKLDELVITILSIKDNRLSIGGKKINGKSCNVEFFYQNETHELPVKFTDYLLNYGIEEGKKYRALCILDSPLEIFEILACVSENISIYPSVSSYIESLAFAPDIFSKYFTLIPFYDMEGDLIFSSGNYAAVFKMKCQVSGKIYALKVFHRAQEGRTESYTHISKHINNTVSPYLVHYDYCEKEIEVDGHEYPALIMEWVEGQTLGNYLTELVETGDRERIFQLACNFDKMALWLLEQPFAHGDLKTDNILIDENGTLRLIDYDGMFTPEMQSQHARENGSPGFRHPGRLPEHFGQHIDDFSILLISLSLHALAANPDLVSNNNFGDNLLFSEESIGNFEHFTWLNLQLLRDNSNISQRIVMMQMAAGNPATMRLLGLRELLNSTHNKTIPSLSDIDFVDEDFEIYWSKLSCGFMNKKTGRKICPPIYDYALPFSEGLALVMLNRKCGFINQNGNLDIAFKYDFAEGFSYGRSRIKLNNLWGVINKKGNQITPICYSYLGSLHENSMVVSRNDKWGFINENGKEFIPLVYQQAGRFCSGLALVKLDGKAGFIDINGNIVIPLIYDSAGSFSEGLAKVCIDDEWGFIDEKGKLTIPHKYEYAENFQDGISKVKYCDSWSIIDKSGAELLPFVYDNIEPFNDGIAITKNFETYGLIDNKGAEIIPPIYYRISFLTSDIAAVEQHFEYGIINKNGVLLCPIKYTTVGDFSEGLAEVKCDEKSGFIDELAKEIIPLKYEEVYRFREGFAAVKLNGHWGFINKINNIIIKPKYDNVRSFNEGYAAVSLKGKWAFIDIKDNISFHSQFDDAGSFNEGFADIKIKDKWGFVDKKGNIVIPPKYDSVNGFHNGISAVSINNKYGFIDKQGQEFIKPKYDLAGDFGNGFASVWLDRTIFWIDRKGNEYKSNNIPKNE